MSEHTEGPWRYTLTSTGYTEIHTDEHSIGGTSQLSSRGPEDAARIVACVNALEGIEDPALFVRSALDILHNVSPGEDDILREMLANLKHSLA